MENVQPVHRAEVTFRPATAEDCRFVAAHLREADRREVLASGFRSSLAALETSFHGSDVVFAGLIDGEVSMIFGVGAPIFADAGTVWALGTDNLTRHPREMLIHGRAKVRELLEQFPAMENYCDARYTAAHRWLKRIGFTLSGPVPHGPHGEPFVKIMIRKET